MSDTDQVASAPILPGSIVEISLVDSFGYVEVSHLHDTYPEVLKVCTKSFTEPLPDPRAVVFDHVCLFPLASSIASGYLQANVRTPLHNNERKRNNNSPFPVIRFAVRNEQGDALYWWLWNGEQIELAGDQTVLDNLPERRVLLLDEFRQIFS